jgi:hypothetical protein
MTLRSIPTSGELIVMKSRRAHLIPSASISPTRELDGFDRTAAISNQSAEAIARAAQNWGQDDDISVLTIIPAAAEAIHAAIHA